MRFCILARAATAVVLGVFVVPPSSGQEPKPATKPTVQASELGKSKPGDSAKTTSNESTQSSSSDSQKSGTSETTVTVAPPAAEKTDSSGKETKPDGNDNSIRVTVNEVIVPITVTDEKGRFVSDLDKKDFQVYEENKLQNIQYFTRERSQPVVIGFLLDLSTASRIHWKNYQNAATELVQTLLTGDQKYSGYLIAREQGLDQLGRRVLIVLPMNS